MSILQKSSTIGAIPDQVNGGYAYKCMIEQNSKMNMVMTFVSSSLPTQKKPGIPHIHCFQATVQYTFVQLEVT